MRPRRLYLVLGLLFAQSASAQYAGLTLGRASSTVDWQLPTSKQSCSDVCIVDISPNQSRRSFLPALSIAWRNDRWLGLTSEASIAQKGFAVTAPTMKATYLETPLLLRVGRLTYPRSPVGGFLELGPAPALKLESDPAYPVRGFDISGLAGIGAAIRLGRAVVVVGARIDRGFMDVGGGPGGVPTKNRSAVRYLGLLWHQVPRA